MTEHLSDADAAVFFIYFGKTNPKEYVIGRKDRGGGNQLVIRKNYAEERGIPFFLVGIIGPETPWLPPRKPDWPGENPYTTGYIDGYSMRDIAFEPVIYNPETYVWRDVSGRNTLMNVFGLDFGKKPPFYDFAKKWGVESMTWG